MNDRGNDAALPAGDASPVPERRSAERARQSREKARRILEERARSLARPAAEPATGETTELLGFRLARESYAVETRFVVAVFRLVDLTPLPGAEPPVYGVTAWRGEVLTVLDLRRLLGASPAALDDLSRVIVLGERRAAFGVLADEVRELSTVGTGEILSAPQDAPGDHDYLRGMTRDAVLVLDAARLLKQYAGST